NLEWIRRMGPAALERLDENDEAKKLEPDAQRLLARMDWEQAFRTGHRWFDRLTTASRSKDRAERDKQLAKVEEDLAAFKKDAAGWPTLVNGLVGQANPEKLLGQAFGYAMASILMPNSRKRDRCCI